MMEFSSENSSNQNKINLHLAKLHSLTANLWMGHCTIYLVIFICVSCSSCPANPTWNRFYDRIRVIRDFTHPSLWWAISVRVHVRGENEDMKREKRKRDCRPTFHLYAIDFPLPLHIAYEAAVLHQK